MRRLRVGFFSFTGCEGCAMTVLDALESNWLAWQQTLDFRYFKLLKGSRCMDKLDVAVVEGAISTETEVQQIKKIRKNCRVLVAIGACAICAGPAGYRNFFTSKKIAEIKPYLKKFKYLKKVYPVSKFVKVDYKVEGCPMDKTKFINLIERMV